MLDYHLHLWPHGRPGTLPAAEQLAAYCEQAATVRVVELAITEHLFRFAQADAVLGGFWEDDPSASLRRAMAAYWEDHARADLDTYVAVVLEAQRAGLPLRLGLEVDHYAGRMDKVASLLDGYPFDVLLGSVHWLGAWGFDNYEDPSMAAEWDRRGVEEVWSSYTEAVEELAQSGVCDVLAHPDLCKVTGRVPAVPDEFYDRLAEALAGTGMAAEVSSAGLRKPAREAYPAPALLGRLSAAGVRVTTASDAHDLPEVGHGLAEIQRLVRSAGYETVTAYHRRQPRAVPLGAG